MPVQHIRGVLPRGFYSFVSYLKRTKTNPDSNSADLKSLEARPGIIVLRCLFFWFFLKISKSSGALLRLCGVLMSVSLGHWGRCRQKVVWNYPRGFGMGLIEILFVIVSPAAVVGAQQDWQLSLQPSVISRIAGDPRSSWLLDNRRSQNQVSVNFVEMRLPPQGSNGVCEAWVQLEEAEEHNLGTLIGGTIDQKIFRYVNIFFFRFTEVLWPHSAKLPRTKCDHVR